MPEPGERALSLINLYNACRRGKVLPFPGAYLDQPAWLMDVFDLIDMKIEEEKARQAEKERMDEMKRDLWPKTRR